ncbi:hypothetical protein H6G89_14780 [Oscillatoria sp. FACHB-1407]|uniref:hypothetical protein n=1 Tax=Oscillatoria sp. FACHB-1407 TaxID=2692847 RepID=UPI00168A3B24|nr:hypothetical protein [Oscillatoria sp. FACHB-1407]MBD2462310.1 hypothetical protein [Oscillatoria sp. FACHB-1407]
MGFWEFLIQKEGDRSWLPLESPDVEILEGRYRVVARSNRVNTPVEIQVTHIAIAETPPKRRTQKRSSQTNPDGLVVVIPFTRLQPGIWELSCSGDLMADFAGEGWQYTVKLQVLSHASEATEEWEPDWQADAPESQSTVQAAVQADPPPPENSASAVAQPTSPPTPPEAVLPPEPVSPPPELERLTIVPPVPHLEVDSDADAPRANLSEEIAASDIFQMATRLSQEVVDSVFQDLEATAEPPIENIPATGTETPVRSQPPDVAPVVEPTPASVDTPVLHEASTADYPPVQLALNRDTYTARRGQTLTLTGQVERSPVNSSPVAIPAVELRIRLSDPQTAQTLVNVGRSLPIQTVPSPFECTITIPDGYQTRLLLGDITLVAGTTELATHPFSVTADLTELLEALANAYPESDLVQPPLEFTAPATVADLDLTFLEFLQSPKPMLQFQPADKQAIPPQLNPAKSAQRTPAKSPMTVGVTGSASPTSSPTAASEPSLPPPPATSAGFSGSTEMPPEATPPLSLSELVLDDDTISPQDWQSPASTVPPRSPKAKKAPSPEDQAFQSLNLQNRFFSRLNALASDSELSSWLHQDPIEALPVNEAPLGLDTDLAAHEVVVEDEPLTPSYARQVAPVEPPAELVLPEDEPVPEPQLSIPAGELVSGQSIFVTVKLPDVKSRIYVKMWVLDRQTRSLLDGPRWFMAFVPDGFGHLETRTQVTVPYGCLEAVFEAIAIEMMTKRESHKVVISRTIIPPDLPLLAETDLEI